MRESFADRLLDALNVFVDGLIRFLPGLLAALLVALVGVAAALAVRVLVRRLLVVARFDRLCDSWGGGHLLRQADIRRPPSALAAAALFWLVLGCFAMVGLAALQVPAIDSLIAAFFLYLPRLGVAFVILAAGVLLAHFLARGTLLAAVNANAPSPRVFALVVRLLVTIVAFAMALEQLQIARTIVVAAFVIGFGAPMLALALAFGLGGRDVARRMLERQLEGGREARGEDELSHL